MLNRTALVFDFGLEMQESSDFKIFTPNAWPVTLITQY
jgi:hypothetical protein